MTYRRIVINLVTRPDRRREMQLQLDKIKWEADFMAATKPTDPGPFPSIGARGCFESHLAALRTSLGAGVILMEDDLNFSSDFRFRWDEALRSLPDDWSIFYPAHHEIGSGLIPPDTAVLRTHMMVFRASIVPFIVSELQTIYSRPAGHPDGGPMHVDGAYSTIRRQHPHIKTYGLSPALGYQRSSRTDIGKLHWLDEYPSIARVARKAKTLLSR